MQAEAVNRERARDERALQPRLQITRGLGRDLVLDGHMRPPPARVLRAQQTVEGIGQLAANAVEIRGHDAVGDAPAQVHQPRDYCARRRLQRGERGEPVARFGFGRGRERMDPGQMRGQLIAFGRKILPLMMPTWQSKTK